MSVASSRSTLFLQQFVPLVSSPPACAVKACDHSVVFTIPACATSRCAPLVIRVVLSEAARVKLLVEDYAGVKCFYDREGITAARPCETWIASHSFAVRALLPSPLNRDRLPFSRSRRHRGRGRCF
eukprot:5680317-Pleurochrysis_carterae.AAC.2